MIGSYIDFSTKLGISWNDMNSQCGVQETTSQSTFFGDEGKPPHGSKMNVFHFHVHSIPNCHIELEDYM